MHFTASTLAPKPKLMMHAQTLKAQGPKLQTHSQARTQTCALANAEDTGREETREREKEE